MQFADHTIAMASHPRMYVAALSYERELELLFDNCRALQLECYFPSPDTGTGLNCVSLWWLVPCGVNFGLTSSRIC